MTTEAQQRWSEHTGQVTPTAPEQPASTGPSASTGPPAPTRSSSTRSSPSNGGARSLLARVRRQPPPARLRIVGWILLTTLIGLILVILTVRGALSAEVARDANAGVMQEADEFIQFAEEGVDPTTAQPFTSISRLLEVHLQRQFPDDDEVMIGWDPAGLETGQSPVQVQARTGPYRLGDDIDLVTRMATGEAKSGLEETPEGTMRWARVDVDPASADDPGGSFIVGHFTAADEMRSADTVRLVTLISAGVLLLTAGVAWIVAGAILAPIRLVRTTAADITERDLTGRIPVRGRDDIADLATTFNDMLDRLEQAFRTQRQFVDDAGHELRTPITIVRGHLELMGDDPHERDQTLLLVTDELDRMSRIVNDLLVLAKVERPDFVRPAPVDVADLTIELDAKVQRLADRRWILEHVADGTALLDRQRVSQAVLQLAQNAVQHTRDDDEIRIGSTFLNENIAFWVTDTGPGVNPHEAGTIFERFAHGTATLGSGERAGAGLGLAIVRAIAEAHEGEPYLSSPPGKGATFGMLLPVGAGGPRHDDDLSEPEPGTTVPGTGMTGTEEPVTQQLSTLSPDTVPIPILDLFTHRRGESDRSGRREQ